MTMSPPEYDLRPETRARQRAELVAIVSQETATAPRRRLVPLVAAAAVVAITAGLAVGLPALRSDNGQPPVSSTNKSQPATVEPLSDADEARLGKICLGRSRIPYVKPGQGALGPGALEVNDGFRFSNAPGDAFMTTWVVIRHKPFDLWTACGMNSEGKVLQVLSNGRDQVLYHAVDSRAIGAGSYAAHVTRITIAVGNQAPVDAVLRHGFFYAPVPYVRVRGPHTAATPLPYTVRGYDAVGQLVYSSPENDGEWRAAANTCYIGKPVTGTGRIPGPGPKICRRTFSWNYLPR